MFFDFNREAISNQIMIISDTQGLKFLYTKDELYQCKDNSDSILANVTGDNKELCVFSSTLGSNDVESISKMLTATSYNDNSYIILEIPENKFLSFKKAQEMVKFKKALIFGLFPTQLMMNITPNYYTPYTINGVKFLFSASFDQLNDERNLKTHKLPMWNQVKTHFGAD